MNVNIVPVENEFGLFCQYPGQTEPQECYVEIDLRTGEVHAEVNAWASGVPLDVHNGLVRRFILPYPIRGSAANRLMNELVPLFKKLVNCFTERLNDRNNWVGILTPKGEEIADEIESFIGVNITEADQIVGWDACDWFNSVGIDELGINADTSDNELDEIIDREIETAEASGVVIVGIDAYLYDLRDELIETN